MSIKLSGDRYLKTRPGLETRPTPSLVRAALFNIWQAELEAAVWLDLCTGSGAIGLEALNRGARRVVGIEQASAACKVIRANWGKHDPERSHLYQGDVLKLLAKLPSLEPAFDLVYFDPPYASDLYEPVLEGIAPLLHHHSRVAVEHHKKRDLPQAIAQLRSYDQRCYGQTAISFYQLGVH
ncbi:MAG: 16S rRNA (guanine(966)-N(2))-methyltransferase RsmD [Pseudanabaenaceae cyanobacterium bins.68]|nr:16S rRNA (guanine(966)-N(2))-methyltransferase RsmD [Pseudanabaenaceae cyanobacterium bins.68]